MAAPGLRQEVGKEDSGATKQVQLRWALISKQRDV